MVKLPSYYAKFARLVGGLVIAATLAGGCGLKGPLYRPGDDAQQSDQPGASPVKRKKSPFDRMTAPQSQKKDTGSATPSDAPAPADSASGTPVDPPAAIDPDRPTTPTP